MAGFSDPPGEQERQQCSPFVKSTNAFERCSRLSIRLSIDCGMASGRTVVIAPHSSGMGLPRDHEPAPNDGGARYEGVVAFAILVIVLGLMVLWSRQLP
jgi:hypothetical protein